MRAYGTEWRGVGSSSRAVGFMDIESPGSCPQHVGADLENFSGDVPRA